MFPTTTWPALEAGGQNLGMYRASLTMAPDKGTSARPSLMKDPAGAGGYRDPTPRDRNASGLPGGGSSLYPVDAIPAPNAGGCRAFRSKKSGSKKALPRRLAGDLLY